MISLVISYANICLKESILYRIVVYVNIILTKISRFDRKDTCLMQVIALLYVIVLIFSGTL